MIPPVIFHGSRTAMRMPGKGGAGGDPGPGGSYAVRFGILMAVLAVLGAVAGIAWNDGAPRPSRRTPTDMLDASAVEPMVRGALGDVGADRSDAQVTVRGGETRWWKRRYDELSAVITTGVSPDRAGPFLRALGDSVERRLADGRATLRDVDDSAWPDSLNPARPTGPARLSLPYATRRRVGWVTLQAVDGQRMTVWLTVHEGPKPSD